MQWWTLKQLSSRNSRTRLHAAERLGHEGETALIQPFIQLLSDPDANVRAAAASGLGRIRAAAAAAPLADRLPKEPDPDARRAMVKALQQIGSVEAHPALVFALGDPVGEVGWLAAKALQAMRWEPATDTERAAWHLAVSQYEDAISYGSAAIDPLTRLSQGVEFHRCIRAVEALAKVGGAQAVRPLLDCLVHKDFTVRSAAANALGDVGDARAVDPLIHSLRDPHHQVCLASCVSLGKMGDQRAVEHLIKIVKHDAPDVRTAAVGALGRLRDSLAVMPIVEQLQDSDLEVREASATALGLIGDEKAIEHLVMSLTDSHSTVRQASANALRRIEPYWERSEAAFRAIPNLQLALKNKDYWVRHSAADVLRKLGVSEAQESRLPVDSDGALVKRQAAQTVLKAMLADRDREFRQAAAEALGRVGLSDSIPPLVERLSDTDLGVRAAAARSLEGLRWQPERVPDKARQLVALERWTEAAALGPEAADALAEILSRREARYRRRAMEALVQMGGPKAVSALRAISTHPLPEIRDDAISALAILESIRVPGKDRPPDVWSEVLPTS